MNEAGLRKLCMPWAGVSNDIKWQHDLVFSVRSKMFVRLGISGSRVGYLAFKVPDDQFLAITDLPGIIPAPYAARFKWVSIARPEDFEAVWLARMTRQSYDLVTARLPKKTRTELRLG